MEHLHFGSTEEMRRHLIDARRLNLAPPQRALGPGDYWIRFHRMGMTTPDIRWGRVMTDDDIRQVFYGEDEHVQWAIVRAARKRRDDRGELHSYEWKRDATVPVRATISAFDVWPIERRLFKAAAEVDYVADDLPDWGRLLLEVAFRSHRAHLRTA
jgi:hypothetical protein